MTIPHSVALKLMRAKEHVKALEVSINAFLNDEPLEATRVIKSNGTEHVWVFTKHTDTPDCFGLMVGDAVHNLRSSLDHLTVALAEAGAAAKGMTMTPKQEAGLQFPIVTSDQGFADQVRRGRLDFIEPTAQAFIESRQPHKICPQDPGRALLAVIGRLDNTDKHRQINTAANVVLLVQDNWPVSLRNTQLQPPATTPGRWKAGAEVARFLFDDPQTEMDVPVEVRFGVSLPAAQDPTVPFAEEILRKLGDFVNVIESIVEPLSSKYLT